MSVVSRGAGTTAPVDQSHGDRHGPSDGVKGQDPRRHATPDNSTRERTGHIGPSADSTDGGVVRTGTLLELLFNAPLTGVRKRWPEVLHAIEMDGVPVKTWPHGKATSACGLTGLRVVAVERSGLMLWPPRVASLPDGLSRCRVCHEATGKRRPRSNYVSVVAA